MAESIDMDKAVMNEAFIPPLEASIRTGRDGGRVTIEVSERDMPEFAKLIFMKGKHIRATFEIVEEEVKYGGRLKDG